MNALVTCSDITIRFDTETVLQHFSCTIPEGSHTIFKGASGSGKSTLLKLLLGFVTPTEGSLQYADGQTARQMRSHIAWLPQDLDLGDGSVEELMYRPFEFAANQLKTPSAETRLSVLKKLGLSEDTYRKQFRDLSTGQRQRVGLAICHLLNKPLLLLDEPTSALDKASKDRAIDLLLAHTNKTIISTSHDPYWVKQGDNIILLD
ncbi:ABC transporter ATP-binding protein [Fodinibius sediminis]|uniref:Amino acid ABC transporter ATP-binding protein, PAAT family n=1 Tax=Fodinibius sediminis TaxID=1214077 RepID=A0A521BIW6_9BACT|nr:ATP-binding cassette domain-containing protein [Fodinibius sediminis]SMO46989.1 amino acid ABC transporter ATP-binding protein, PAAT family [Fodinibius sediminis]